MEQKRKSLNDTCSGTDINANSRTKGSMVSTNLKCMALKKNDAIGKTEHWHTLIWVLPL